MFLSIGALAVAGGTLYTGVNAIKQRQKKKKRPWTYYAETRGITKMGTFGGIRVNAQLKRRSKMKSGGEVLERVFGEQLPTLSASATSLLRSGVSAIGDFTEETLAPLKSRVSAIGDFTEEKLAPLFSNMHAEHLKQMSLDGEILSEQQKRANQRLRFSAALLVSCTASVLIYPPLGFLHVPFLIYNQAPIYKKAHHDLFKEKRITRKIVLVVMGIGSIFYSITSPSVFVVIATIGWMRAYNSKLVTETKNGTRKELVNLMGEQPKRVWVVQGDIQIEVPFQSLSRGDLIVVNAGQMIPVDGIIHDGVATIDQHKLTGESQPVEKGVGGPVFAATVVLSGRIYIRVEKTGQETAAAQIGQILTQTSDFTANLQLRGEEIADRGALPMLILGGLSWFTVGPSQALAVLCTSPGGSMQMLGPLGVLNFLQLAAYKGVLIKDGRALEQVRKIDTVVFDKTGTITLETPHVGRIFTCSGYDEEELLTYSAAAELRQTHPIAKAILQEASVRELSLPPISEAAYEVGYGIKVTLGQKQIRVGSRRFMAMEGISMSEEVDSYAKAAHEEGHSLVYVASSSQLAGAIELVPTVRPEAKSVIDSLRQGGMEIVIISGDHERPTRALANALGIDHYFAETLPEEKASIIARLQEEGKSVCFVGDGINDSIALKTANVSVSLRGATTIATDTAQVILMDETLNQLKTLFEISQKFESNLRVSLITSIVPGTIVLTGAFAGVIGFASGLALLYMGLFAGITNTMLPRLKLLKEHANPVS